LPGSGVGGVGPGGSAELSPKFNKSHTATTWQEEAALGGKGKMMDDPWENHGKTMGKPWENQWNNCMTLQFFVLWENGGTEL